jgi:hypothetical protein
LIIFIVFKGFIMSGVTDKFVEDLERQLDTLHQEGILDEETKSLLNKFLLCTEIRNDPAVASSVIGGLKQTLNVKIQDLSVRSCSCACFCVFRCKINPDVSKLEIINFTKDMLDQEQERYRKDVRSKQAQKQTAKEDNTEEGFRKKLNALLMEVPKKTGHVNAMILPASDCLKDGLVPNHFDLEQLKKALIKRADAAPASAPAPAPAPAPVAPAPVAAASATLVAYFIKAATNAVASRAAAASPSATS